MTLAIQECGFVGGLLLGVAGTILSWQVGPAVIESGWTSAACALALTGAAGALAFSSWRMDGVDPVLRDMAELPDPPAHRRDRQADRPRDWLRDNGIATLPRAETMQALRSRLSAGLTFHHPASDGAFGEGHSNETSALATAFAAMAGPVSHRKSARRLLKSLADAYGRIDPTGRAAALAGAVEEARRLSHDPSVRAAIRKALDRHATRETFAMGLLQEARREGIVAPNEFAWLRDVHPGLWYALDNVGRMTFHVEGLAAMDHFRHEEAAGRRLTTPHIGMAARSLLGYLVLMRKELAGGGEPEDRLWDEEADLVMDLSLYEQGLGDFPGTGTGYGDGGGARG